MTDRELMEKAAKAAGIKVAWCDGVDCLCYADRPHNVAWIPLTEDGDALRLAVQLGIDLHLFRAIPQERRPQDLFARACVDRLGRCFAEQVVDDDPGAAARRAIVRAAAAIADSLTPNASFSRGPSGPSAASDSCASKG